MIQSVITFLIAVIIFIAASSINLHAQAPIANAAEDKPVTVEDTTKSKSFTEIENEKRARFFKELEQGIRLTAPEKSTLDSYEQAKKSGKKFSTTTKVLIGVGIAAAVVGVVVFAASRDKIKTF